METLQLLNTAIVKRKELKLKPDFEERLRVLNESPVIEVLHKAIIQLSDMQKVTRDQAALMIVETMHELEMVWDDYIAIEGVDKLKSNLQN